MTKGRRPRFKKLKSFIRSFFLTRIFYDEKERSDTFYGTSSHDEPH